MPEIQIISVGHSIRDPVPTAASFFDIMNEIEEFQNQQTENLCYEHYESLSETATAMRSLANTLTHESNDLYLASRLRDAKLELAFYRQLVKQMT